MKIGGLLKNSFIDYPARVSSVVFVSGCNFHCPYCHNPELVTPRPGTAIPQDEVIHFLGERVSFLDGVVVSGGEPTLDPALEEFLSRIREMGYPVKLDTNGSRPDVLGRILEQGLVDYLAMDIKTVPTAYPSSLVSALPPDAITRSIDIVMHAGIDYEFRTTCARPFITPAIVRQIAPFVSGARHYILQRCQGGTLLNPAFFGASQPGCSENEINDCHALLSGVVESCHIR